MYKKVTHERLVLGSSELNRMRREIQMGLEIVKRALMENGAAREHFFLENAKYRWFFEPVGVSTNPPYLYISLWKKHSPDEWEATRLCSHGDDPSSTNVREAFDAIPLLLDGLQDRFPNFVDWVRPYLDAAEAAEKPRKEVVVSS